MLVARLPSPARGAAVGPIAVTDSSAGCDIGCEFGGGRSGGAGLDGADGYPGPPRAAGCGEEGYRGCGADGYAGGRCVLGGGCGRETCGEEAGGCDGVCVGHDVSAGRAALMGTDWVGVRPAAP
jgi:hypothetical protein